MRHPDGQFYVEERDGEYLLWDTDELSLGLWNHIATFDDEIDACIARDRLESRRFLLTLRAEARHFARAS